jgi:hypothetical protein
MGLNEKYPYKISIEKMQLLREENCFLVFDE